jgi:hypothetical protein
LPAAPLTTLATAAAAAVASPVYLYLLCLTLLLPQPLLAPSKHIIDAAALTASRQSLLLPAVDS